MLNSFKSLFFGGDEMENDEVSQESEELPQLSEEEFEEDNSRRANKHLKLKDQALQIIEKLVKLRNEGKKRGDKEVQKLENDMCELFHVCQKSWIPKEASLNELISILEIQLKISGKIHEHANQWLSGKMLLQKCSDGRALKGILLSKNLTDQLQDRHQLLEIPEEVNIDIIEAGCRGEDRHVVECFSSSYREDNFKKAMNFLGCTIGALPNVPVYENFVLNYGVSTNHKNEPESYSSTVKFSIMEIAILSFDETTLNISKKALGALAELAKIYESHDDNIFKNTAVYEACKKLFHTYGSHANLGPITFGGQCSWTCSTNEFTENSRDVVKKMQIDALAVGSDITIPGFDSINDASIAAEVTANFKDQLKETTLVATKLKFNFNGGPLNATDVHQWKDRLLASNTTWSLTDRGKKLIAIWDIIEISHKREFGHLCEVLKTSWKTMTEADNLTLVINPELTPEQLCKWNKETQLTPRHFEERLEQLRESKREILTKASSLWIKAYLLHPSIQSFFLSMMNFGFEPSQLKNIKSCIQELVLKDELNQLSPSFPGYEQFSEWLYHSIPLLEPSQDMLEDITDSTSFLYFVNKTWYNFLSQGSKISPEALAHFVDKGIGCLQLHKKTYDNVFMTIMLFPLQYSKVNSVKLKPLSIPELIQFSQTLSIEMTKFESYKINKFHLQCYLLLLAVDQSQFILRTQFCKFMTEITLMMKELPSLDEELLEQLKRHLVGPEFMTEFIEFLKTLMKSHQAYPKGATSMNNASKTLVDVLLAKKHQDVPGDKQDTYSKNDEVDHLLTTLHLSEQYPKKLSLKYALCIREEPLELSLSDSHVSDPKQLPNLILHKLMSYDSKCRSDMMQYENMNQSSIMESDEDSDDNFKECVDEHANCLTEDFNSDSAIHPVDCLIALFTCSNDFLLQDLFSRLAKCQLAVPFLLPDPITGKLNLPLWAMRSIIPEWKSTNDNGEVMEHTHCIVNYPMPVISFIRIGKPKSRGKSKILNAVISESHHDFFFHHDCSGGEHKRILGEGLVDMCWYLPAGKPTDIFSNAITFLNLHGDARKYPHQCRFMSEVSSMCFVLIAEKDLKFDTQLTENLEMFSLSPGGLTILNDVNKAHYRDLKQHFGDNLVITSLTGKNEATIKKYIRERIKNKVRQMNGLRTVEDICVSNEIISVDEDSKSYQEGLYHAKKLIRIIMEHKNETMSMKEMMIPLQGDLWKNWAAKDKEEHKHNQIGNEEPNKYRTTIANDKKKIRNEQYKHIKTLTPLMESFITSLLYVRGPHNKCLRNFFLQSLKLELNTLSRKSITGIQHKYQSTRKALSKLTPDNNYEETEEIISLKEKLTTLQELIINTSFGLEHLLRELSQVYEAAIESQEYGDMINQLPQTAAELLIDGYPLELMDGDAAYVPLMWVNAVLDETVKKLSDPKIFVLSVLGLQSTGKSTLLNTTFGVQFNVSAGRCTRGAFMQLLPLDEEILRETGCSYVLIVDTEGLRAPELDQLKTQKHDNELATFVIGLANTTLINIAGEVSGDMDDILQTSVHAFLRMTKIKYHPSCQFIHQNASVNIKGEVARAKFTQKLNQFTLDAAKEEHCEGQCKSFNDVIKFDDQTDVHYFPGLWKGDPPMAPVNEGYSNAAQTLKQRIVDLIKNKDSRDDLTLSAFQRKISDLWNALLTENFVFSFKNTLEISAYKSLEAAYSKWDWEFRKTMLEWEQQAENEITPDPPLPIESVSELVDQKLTNVQDCIIYKRDSLQKEMEEFFNGKHSEILVQWKAKFQIRLGSLAESLLLHAKEHCNRLLSSRQAISAFENDKQKYIGIMQRKVQQHIDNLKQDQLKLEKNLEKKKLTSEQLTTLIKRNLFSTEMLAKYREQEIIKSDKIKQITLMCGDKLTKERLEKILFGGDILTLDQVKLILKRTRQTEKELEEKFEDIWKGVINTLPGTIERLSSVEAEVHQALTEFARTRGYDGQLICKQRGQRKWGTKLDLKLEKDTHFKKNTAFMHKWVYKHFRPDPLVKAQEITGLVFQNVDLYIQTTTKTMTDFYSSFTTELLNLVDAKINEFSSTIGESFTFTIEYRVEMYLTASYYALPRFQSMADTFRKKNDPLMYLEEHEKAPLFSKFKNQYQQTEAEEAIAETLCAYLKEPIKKQVGKSLCRLMVTKMKNSNNDFFSSKMALKVKVLTDLHKDDDFDKYMLYIRNVQTCLKEYIQGYTVAFCNEEVSGETRLQLTAKEEVTRLIEVIKVTLTEVDQTNYRDWLSNFCEHTKLRSELGLNLKAEDMVSAGDSSQELDLENLKRKIITRLDDLVATLHSSYDFVKCEEVISEWKDKPHEHLLPLIGCTAQCPFCMEQCDLQDTDHIEIDVKHRTEVHRMDCLGGWRSEATNKMNIDFCPNLVSSEERRFKKAEDSYQLYNKYQEVYPDWSIKPDMTLKSSLYWAKFLGRYKDDLGVEYKALPPDVPPEWSDITWEEVERNLKEFYHL